jgi:hypothetical protein
VLETAAGALVDLVPPAAIVLPFVAASEGGAKMEVGRRRLVHSGTALELPISRVVGFAFVAWVILATALGRSFTALGLAGNDAHLFAYMGQKWFAGRLLYRDVWDNKPPGIFLVTALVFSPAARGFAALAVVEGLLVLGCIATVHAILRRTGASRAVALLGTALCALMANLRYYNEGGALTEIYVLLPASLSILLFLGVLAALAAGSSRRGHVAALALAAGLLGGVATTFKLVGAACLLAEAAVVTLGWTLGRFRWPHAALVLAGVATGFCLTWAPWLLYFHRKGLAGEMLWASFVAPLYYGAESQQHLLHLPVMLAERLGPIAGAAVAALAGAAALAVAVRPTIWGPRAGLAARAGTLWVDGRGTLLALWLLFDLLAALAGGRGYPHYFLALSASLAVSAALATCRLVDRPLAGPEHAPVKILVAALICASGVFAQIGDFHGLRMALGSPPPDEPVADYVSAHSRPGDTLFSWPYHPQLFFATGLDSPHRLTSAINLQDSPRMRAAAEDDLLRTLETTPPSFLVDVRDDARGRVDATSPLAPAHARFQRLLAAKYDLVLASNESRLYRVRP